MPIRLRLAKGGSVLAAVSSTWLRGKCRWGAQEGLRATLRRRRRPRLGVSTISATRLDAEQPDHVSAIDFQFDQAADGSVSCDRPCARPNGTDYANMAEGLTGGDSSIWTPHPVDRRQAYPAGPHTPCLSDLSVEVSLQRWQVVLRQPRRVGPAGHQRQRGCV